MNENLDSCTCPSGDGSLRHPCPAHPATLATAKHGGCVQLGDGLPPMPKTGYVTGGDFGHEAHNAFTPEQMQDYARAAIAAALSAQPSPGVRGMAL